MTPVHRRLLWLALVACAVLAVLATADLHAQWVTPQSIQEGP